MANTKLKISGMTCDHCKEAVERRLNKIPGAKNVAVNRQAGEATIEWDDEKASRNDLVDAVNELGYNAQ